MEAVAKPADIPGPHLSVLAVVTRDTARGAEVLLVRRANPPQPGHWGFPGGKVDWGEGLRQAAIRELKEETGIDGANPVVFDTIDLIVPDLTDARSGSFYHHLMIAVRLDWRAGEPMAGDDALEARWASADDLPRPLCARVPEVAAQAVAAVAAPAFPRRR
ncbi:MAG: NUDIX domain-containing protein [Kiloniellaceae bacterium]|nr:NUDIX domain-containing protein [Kiloniellaceae bacterium]